MGGTPSPLGSIAQWQLSRSSTRPSDLVDLVRRATGSTIVHRAVAGQPLVHVIGRLSEQQRHQVPAPTGRLIAQLSRVPVDAGRGRSAEMAGYDAPTASDLRRRLDLDTLIIALRSLAYGVRENDHAMITRRADQIRTLVRDLPGQ